MNTIEIARKMAALGDKAGAVQAYMLALNEDGTIEPAEKLEAAAFILQSGGDYKISYTCFLELYNDGYFQADILPLMTAVFYEPNEKTLRTRYERNCKQLSRYPYLFRQDFPAFEDLPIQFFSYDEHNGYVPFFQDSMRFGGFVNVKHPVVSRNFFKDLDKPILAEDVFSQYELEYLNDNVRKSEYIGRENHIYLHYPSWETFCAWLQVLNMRPLLEDKKIVFLIGDEISQYPIDFKERFGIDYSQCPLKPVGIREINRLIWHTQLSTHNGGDFFNEVFDAHPNLLAFTSIMFDNTEENIKTWKDSMNKAEGSREVLQEFIRANQADPRVLQELSRLRNRSDKDIFVAMFLSNPKISQFLDTGSRIAPALFFQPHFSNIVYDLHVDRKGNTVLDSQQYQKACQSPIFRGFKYIKTFTPMRRFTTSHGATVKFMFQMAQQERKEGEPIGVVADAVSQRILNRSFMIDWQDRLYQDSVQVRLEDGKLNPKATFTALAAFLDLPYTESMTYCSFQGERDPFSDVEDYATGFDPSSVYKTYDDFANDSERCYIEYFLRDAYEYFGYAFKYYDGGPMDLERIKTLVADFSKIDYYMRETWKKVYDTAGLSSNGQPLADEIQQKMRQGMLDQRMAAHRQNREKNAEILMRGLRFVNRNGQPLHMMKKLELDPALLEQPIYH
ncbi:MAG: hypothetical protein HFF50_01300 [Lawsonibacter sp.]|nr:hypothetical protein [Lawsonibacter sp.]